MREVSLETLFFGEEDFISSYKKLKKARFFLADSVQDFVENKNNLQTPLSDLIFLSNTKYRYIQFNDVQLAKLTDDIHEFGTEERGYTAKLYTLYDKTGGTICIWPTKGSKIPGLISCERFEDIKNFKGGLLRTVSLVYERTTENAWVYFIDFYHGKRQKKKIWKIKEFVPTTPSPLFLNP